MEALSTIPRLREERVSRSLRKLELTVVIAVITVRVM